MKKRTIVMIAMMILAVSTAFGQIICTDEDAPNNRTETYGVMVPMENINTDQYQQLITPLGDGLLLLIGMGGAYLLLRKRLHKTVSA